MRGARDLIGRVQTLRHGANGGFIIQPEEQKRARRLRLRRDPDRNLGQHTQGAVGARNELAEVVAGHVFDNLAARFVDLAPAIDALKAKKMVARGARPDPAWPGEIARQRAAEGRRARLSAEQRSPVGRLAGKHLMVGVQRGFDLGEQRRGRGRSTSSAGSYSPMPDSAETSSTCSTCSGRPTPRFDPPPTISSGCSSAAAQVTTSLTCFASAAWNAAMERSPVSEARQVGEPHLTLMDVHTAEFSATMQLRKHLTGIE